MENKMEFHGGKDEQHLSFYRLPKALFTDEKYRHISVTAKFLYSLMLDRMSLSAKNSWVDEEGRIYIYFTLNEAMERLKVCKDTAMRLFRELDDKTGCGLIRRKRQGLCKPDFIYVENFFADTETPTSCGTEIPASGGLENSIPDDDKTDSNNTDINNNNINNTDINNNILSDRQINDEIRERDLCLQKIHKNIDYKALTANYSKAMIDSIVKVMLDSMCSKKRMLTVGCEKIPQRYVNCRLSELDYSHIEYVIECLQNNRTEIRNIKNYMLTTLYNAPLTIDAYYTAQVNRDLYTKRSSA